MRTQRPDAATTTIDYFGHEFLVACPRCTARALVRDRGKEPENAPRIVLTCPACGLSRAWSGNLWSVQYSRNPSTYEPDIVSIGGPVDWYFHLPLWLQTPCCGEILWAYNADHLDFLEDFVRATLRENKQTERGWSNQSLRSRLPAWIKAAHNRDAVLKGIARLKSIDAADCDTFA